MLPTSHISFRRFGFGSGGATADIAQLPRLLVAAVEALVDGTAHLVLTPATMRKIQNFSAVTSESEGLVVKNRTDLELWVSQEGCAGRGAAHVEPMGEARFHWIDSMGTDGSAPTWYSTRSGDTFSLGGTWEARG